jgi:deoxycytidine triphosphate deaminase
MTSSVLSDGTIRRLVGEGRLRIEPWDPGMVQPASVDLKLGRSFRVFHNHKINAIDLASPPSDLTEHLEIDSNQSFVIHPGEFVLGNTVEQVTMPDDLVARIEGKALAVDTEVPTPAGWRTMGTLQARDQVFSPSGEPTLVVGASEVMYGRDCREVVFSDGTSVVADLDHQWEVRTKYDRRTGRARVLTTRAIETTLRRSPTEYAYHVDSALPVKYPERELPVDPYVLGAWIGDGTSSKSEITTVDAPILKEIARVGYGVRPASGPLAYRIGGRGHTRDPATGRYASNDSLESTLRAMGLLRNKHIPTDYMQSSEDQRRSLLAGLMDTDGYVDTQGRCDITTVDRGLADQYQELLCSLGYRAKVATKTATLYGRICGLRHEVTFTPHEQVFYLPRKAARLALTQSFRFNRAIVDVRPTASVPVRCIGVANAEGTFLVTRAHIPTHNSSLGRLGLIVHATAGFVDPGFSGTLTLEITNLTRVPIVLWPGKPIAQLSFMTLDRPAERPYGHPELGSHYHGQSQATESRYEGGPGGSPARK